MTTTPAATRELFDKWAREGLDIEMEEGHRHAVREALRDVAVVPRASILDVGCGNGYVTRALAKRLPQATVSGIDVSGEMIALARDLTPDEMFNAVFYQGSIQDESIGEQRYDLIVASESIYYISPVADAVKRLVSLLNPGGQIVIVTDYYAENPDSAGWPDKYGVPMERLSIEDYERVFKEAGLEEVRSRRILYTEGENVPAWKTTTGSLAVYGEIPWSLTAEEVIRDTEQ